MAKRIALSLVLFAVLFIAAQAQPVETYTVFIPVLFRTVPITRGVGATYPGYSMEGISWFYDWSHNPPIVPGVEAVPMIWGMGSVGRELGGNSDWVLGFNEPADPNQADLTPVIASPLQREIELAYPDKKLVSPSAPLWWLTQWYDTYVAMYGEPPRLDAVAAHCYGAWTAAGGAASCQGILDQFVAWAIEHDIPEVWVTEYAFLPCWPEGEAGSIAFMEAMQEYFDCTPVITRHAWFQLSYRGDEPWAFGPACNTSLIDFYTGEPTALGKAYVQ